MGRICASCGREGDWEFCPYCQVATVQYEQDAKRRSVQELPSDSFWTKTSTFILALAWPLLVAILFAMLQSARIALSDWQKGFANRRYPTRADGCFGWRLSLVAKNLAGSTPNCVGLGPKSAFDPLRAVPVSVVHT